MASMLPDATTSTTPAPDPLAGERVQISKKLVLVNIASSAAARALSMGALLWVQSFLVRRVSEEEMSLYWLLLSIIVIMPLVTSVLTSGLARYIVEAYAKGDQERVAQIVSTMFPVLLGAGVVIMAGGGVAAWYMDHFLKIAPAHLWDAQIMLGLMVFSFAIALPMAPFGVGLFVRQKFVLSNLIGVGGELLRVVLLFTLVLAVSPRVLWVVVASVSMSVMVLVLTQIFSRRALPLLVFRRSAIRWGMLHELTSFGVWSFVAQLADLIRTSAPALVLNLLATPYDMNCFGFGAVALVYIQQASGIVLAPLMPVVTAMHATGRQDRLRSLYLRGGRLALWVSLLISIPLMFFSQEFITLYAGKNYGPAAIIMPMMLAFFPLAYGHVMLSKIGIATATLGPIAVRSLILQAMNLALMIFLVYYWQLGAIGAAWSILVTIGVFWPLFNYRLGLRMVGLDWKTWLRETIVPPFVPAVVAAGACLAMKLVPHHTTWLWFGSCMVAGMAVYAVITLAFCLRPADRDDLKHMLAAAGIGRAKRPVEIDQP